jgi:fucose 4-O-acetylase-like acetyltransferase
MRNEEIIKNRICWVDYAKAIGIILVVYGHIVRGLHKSGIIMPNDLYKLIDSIIYSFHMPLFFFLSGLFFYNSLSKQGGIKLILSKIDNIVYPYIIWSIIQGLIEVQFSQYTNNHISYGEIFTLFWSPRAQFWFLYALFIIFVLASMMYSVASKKMIIITFLLSSVVYIYPSILPQGFIFGFISQNFVFFSLGVVFSLYHNEKNRTSLLYVVCMVLLFVFSQYIFHGYMHLDYLNKGIASLMLSIISIVAIISLSQSISKKHYRFLSFLGKSSMAIYLMHVIAGSGVRIILKKGLGIDSFIIHLFLGCLFGILIPGIAFYLIDKYKIKYMLSAPINSCVISSYEYILRTRSSLK